MTTRKFENSVKHVQPGSAVNASNTSRPTRDLEARTNYLKEILDSIEAGRLLTRREQTFHPDVLEGEAVFWDDEAKQFDRALAAVENDPETSTFVAKKSADCLGICLFKDSPTGGTVGTVGMAKIPASILANMVIGSPTPGRYYLSGASAGKLVSQRPPVTVAVVYILGPADDCETDSWVFILPQMRDFLEDHIHYQFDLVAAPAGDHVPPAEGEAHVITNADDTQQGWLPADDASFGGFAPTGAKFGYNIAAHGALNRVWPPLPAEASILEMLRNSIYTDVKGAQLDFTLDFPNVPSNSVQDLVVAFPGAETADAVGVNAEGGPDGDGILQAWVSSAGNVTVRFVNPTGGAINPASKLYHIQLMKHIEPGEGEQLVFSGLERVSKELVIIDKNGIWWMSECYNQVPWPTDYDTTPTSSSLSSESSASSEAAVDECPVDTPTQLILSFLKMTFATDKTVVTSLQPAEGEPIRYVNCDGKPASTGDLHSLLDIEALLDPNLLRGGLVFKEIINSQLLFGRGGDAEALIAGSDEVVLSGTHQELLDPTAAAGPANPLIHQGLVTVNVQLDPLEREINPQVVKLGDALEREHKQVTYLGFPNGRDSGIRMRYNVPPSGLPIDPKLKIRAILFGRAEGPFSEMTMSYYRIVRPVAGTPTPIVEGDTAITFDVVTPSDDIDGGGTDLPADEAIEVESAEFTVAAGDTVYVTLERASDATPLFQADIGVIRIGGVIVPGT